MSWLFEDVTPLLAVAALIEFAFIVALLRSGDKRMLFGVIGVAIVCGACVVIETIVETENERVEKAIEKTRQAILTNDLQQVLQTIAPESGKLQSIADRYLAQFTVRAIKITEGPELTFFTNTDPSSVAVVLNARFDFDPSKGMPAYRGGVVRVVGRLRRFSTDWKWTEAEFSNPLSRARNSLP